MSARMPKLAPSEPLIRPLPRSWRMVPSRNGECCRWQSADGEWVSVKIGSDADLGVVIVEASGGCSERLDSYEAAIRLAARWRGEGV